MTNRISANLEKLGLDLPSPFVFSKPNRTGAVISASTLYCSGHPPLAVAGVYPAGKIGAEFSEQIGYQFAREAALSILASAKVVLGDLGRIRRVLKVAGHVNSAPGFNRQFAVIDGASDLFFDLFGEDGCHARTAVGVAELPRSFPLEVEAIFEVHPG
jgi:enamine deaminase RidA (YjgF/YER057c/UK114 family)